MEPSCIFLIFLSVYIAFLVVTGLYFNSKNRSQTDFWLAGRTPGFISVGFSAAASWLTAGALLAVIGFYMLLGMGSVWGFAAPNILALFITGKGPQVRGRWPPSGPAFLSRPGWSFWTLPKPRPWRRLTWKVFIRLSWVTV